MEPVIITRDNNPCNTFFISVVSLEDLFTRSDGYVQVFNSIEQRLYNSLDSLRSEKRQEVYNTKLRRTCAQLISAEARP